MCWIVQAPFEPTESVIGKILSWGRVALLGIAQRQIRVKTTANLGNHKRANALKLNIKTAGDWLKVKRLEKNLTLGHIAAKMGVATSLVCAWEKTQQPDNQQLELLASVLNFNAKDFENVIKHSLKIVIATLGF